MHKANDNVINKSERKSVLVGVRMTAALAKKLDQARGAATRPAKICEILEREL